MKFAIKIAASNDQCPSSSDTWFRAYLNPNPVFESLHPSLNIFTYWLCDQIKMTITEEGIFVSDEQLQPERTDSQEQFLSIGHLVFESLSEEDLADLVIFVDAASGREWTGAQLKDKILSVATALIDLHDFKRGTCVSIDYDHSDYTVILALAVIACGGVVACAFPKDPYAELLYMAKKTEPKFLFGFRRNISWARQLSQDLGYEVMGYVMDGESQDATEHHFMRLLDYCYDKSASRKLVPVACEDRDKDVAFIIMSSGTTGQPKAIPATHSMVIVDTFGYVRRTNPQCVVSYTSSLDYVTGRIALMGAIRGGDKAIIMSNSQPQVLAKFIEKYKINVIALGAEAFYNLIIYEELNKFDLSSLVVASPMGAKLTYLNQLKHFFEKYPQIKMLRQGYGTSESAGVAINGMTPEQYFANYDNCGKLMRGIRAKVVDPETGKLLGPHKTGELRIKSPTLFLGYYDVGVRAQQPDNLPFLRDPKLFDEDGFYATGDIAFFNDREELYIVGRIEELMRCRGPKKVLPYEIELEILKHPAVQKVCVIGIPSQLESTIHCPRAFVVPKACCYDKHIDLLLSEPVKSTLVGLRLSGRNRLCQLGDNRRQMIAWDLMKFLGNRISWKKQLTGGMVLLDEIPISRETGKLNKNYLRSLTLNQIEIFGDQSDRDSHHHDDDLERSSE